MLVLLKRTFSIYEHVIFNNQRCHRYCILPSHVQIVGQQFVKHCTRLCFHSSLLVSVKVLCPSVHTLSQDFFLPKRQLEFIIHLIYHTFLISLHIVTMYRRKRKADVRTDLDRRKSYFQNRTHSIKILDSSGW